jgi:formate dehydrogenase major subunit
VQDLANADCIIIMGSNMAEAHPVGFQWVTEAKLRGARVIHVDPRFTRTSAQSDRHIPIRIGADIAVLGGLINHVLSNDLWFHEYVLHYTNAATIVSEDFLDTEDLDGVYSGWDPEKRSYDLTSWSYAEPGGGKIEGAGDGQADGDQQAKAAGGETLGAAGPSLEHGQVLRDETLQDPRCVFQILKRHFARYTPEMVAEVSGISEEDFAYLADSLVQNSGRERTTSFCYAVGWTQHSDGAQMIRTAGILQLLMGNVGRPGSGIMALRGHASIQGSTDIPTLYNLLPGYLPMPMVGEHDTLEDYIESAGSKDQKGYWANADAYTISLLKAWFGDKATAENNYYYDRLPRLSGAHGTYQTVLSMLDGEIDGYFVLGQNPAVASAHSKIQRKALAGLKWLVVRDLRLIETATFWKDSAEIQSGELVTEDIATEVFFMPAATHVEKAGTFTQTQRLVQWREKALDPPGDCQPELEFFHELGVRIRQRLADSTDPRDQALLDMTWDYPRDEHGEVDPEYVLQEINGRFVGGERDGELLSTFNEMRADGSTSGGCWIYTGIYAGGINRAARKKPGHEQDEMAREWAWAWPADRRILYNRASADPQGKPWSERKKLMWWDEEKGQWDGPDVPDFPLTLAPGTKAEPGATGPAALEGDDVFIMQPDGKGWLYAPRGLVDGPMPTHYEPAESPVTNPLYGVQANPTKEMFHRPDNRLVQGEKAEAVYPYVFTTYRLTEHHTAGGMSRFLPYLAELQPEMFCEISPELAEERGLENGGWATLISPRAAIETRVLVTDRVRPVQSGGRTVHQIGLPYHWAVGDRAVVAGDAANDLLGIVLDPNVQIQESKVGMCDIQPGRRPHGPAQVELVNEYLRRSGLEPTAGEPAAASATPEEA